MQSQIGSNFVWQSKQRKFMSPALDRGELRHAGRRTRTCVDNGPPKYPRLSGTHHCCSHSSSLYHYPASCPTFFNICYGPSPCRSRIQSASPNGLLIFIVYFYLFFNVHRIIILVNRLIILKINHFLSS